MLFLFLAVSVRVTSGFRTALPSYFIIKFLHFFSGLLSKSSVWQTNLFLFEILTLVLRPVLCGLLESTVKCAPTKIVFTKVDIGAYEILKKVFPSLISCLWWEYLLDVAGADLSLYGLYLDS